MSAINTILGKVLAVKLTVGNLNGFINNAIPISTIKHCITPLSIYHPTQHF
jgi:hypothetical protein